MLFRTGTDMYEMMRRALDGAKDNREEYTKSLIEAMVKLQSGNKKGYDVDEIKDFSENIMNEIVSMGKKCVGNDKAVRYSPQIMKLALSLWTRSKKSYKILFDSKLLVLPNPRTLHYIKRKNLDTEGNNPETYSRLADAIKKMNGNNVMGHVMVDEMKLCSDLCINTQDYECVSFVTDNGKLELEDELKKILLNNESEGQVLSDKYIQKMNESKHATHVNQWRFRSTFNQVYNLEFYYNDGSLSGTDILRQLVHVTTMLSAIDVNVLGVTLDAGGSNAGFVKYLLDGIKTNTDGWLDKVSFINVASPFMGPIFIWYCSTHNMKSMRNQLKTCSGTEKAARNVLDVDDIPFGWSNVILQWHRDRQRVENGKYRLTDMTMDTVYPDSWNKMRVGVAKSTFSRKTLSEGMDFFSREMDCLDTILKLEVTQEELAEGWCLTLKRCYKLKEISMTQENVSLMVKAGVADIMYRSHVAEIFNELFMNKHTNINHQNVASIKRRLKLILLYFKKWNSKKEERKKDKDTWSKKTWEQSFLSPVTFYNLCHGICGFIEYAKYILENYDHVMYIPFIHSNTSSLESHFSLMRFLKADTPSKYIRTVNIADNSRAMNIFVGNKMYEGNKEAYMENDNLTGANLKTRENKVTRLEKVVDSDLFMDAFEVKELDERFSKIGLLVEYITKAKVFGSYKKHLLEQTTMRKYCCMFMGTSHETVVSHFLETVDESDNLTFNRVCQGLMTGIFTCYHTSITSLKKYNTASFWVNVRIYLQSSNFCKLMESLPISLRDRTFLVVVFYVLCRGYENMMKSYFEKLFPSNDLIKGIQKNTTYNYKSDVIRFFGWALKSYRQVQLRTLDRTQHKGKKDLLHSKIKLLGDMMTNEAKVRDDDDYMTRCYASVDALYNKGNLTLVAKKYYDLAVSVIIAIDEHVSEQKIHILGNDVMKVASNEMRKNDKIRKKFLLLTEDFSDISEGIRLETINDLIRKTMNSRAGACLDLFAEKHIGHYAKKGAGQSLRAALQASSKATKLKELNKEQKAKVQIHNEDNDKSVREENSAHPHSSPSLVIEDDLTEDWSETFQEAVNIMMTAYDQPIDQPISHPVSQPASQLDREIASQTVSQPASLPASHSARQQAS